MRPYWAVLSARFRMMLQYRAAAAAGVGTQVFWGFIKIMVLEAFFRSSDVEPPIPLAALISYVWLGQALLALLPWNLDLEIREMVRTGRVAYELLRPVDLYALWYVRSLAWRTAGASLRALPIFVFAGLLMPWIGFGEWALAPPASGSAAALWILATLLAIALGCAITTLLHVSLMWTLSGEGVAMVVPAMVSVLSGMVVPLPLFPDWMQPILNALPFRGLVDVPFRIYAGHIAPADAWAPLAATALWTVALVWLGRVLVTRGCRHLVVQGG